MKPQYNPKLTTTQNIKIAYEQGRKELIEEFIKDLNYLETIEPKTHVFERISRIISKWENYLDNKNEQ